jgi:putative ABC transport system permease protein
VAVVLLAEHLVLALAAAAVGLAIGWLAAPLLSAASVLVTVAGMVAVLVVHARFDRSVLAGGELVNPLENRVSQVMTVITVALVVLSAVNALLITWATVLDACRSAAVRHGGAMIYPPAWWLAAVVIAAPLVVGALTVVPSRVAARASVAPTLQAEAA